MENYERTQPSAASVIASGIAPAICLRGSPDAKTSTAASGFAWAARREVLDRHGFYDACIVGGGPGAFASAAYDCFDHAMHIQYMNARQKEHYLAWAEPCHETIRSEASFLEGNLFHLWHGKTEHREYRQRHEKFSRFNFDPLADIMCEPKGAWRWNSDKTTMHNHVRDYFVSRREDG